MAGNAMADDPTAQAAGVQAPSTTNPAAMASMDADMANKASLDLLIKRQGTSLPVDTMRQEYRELTALEKTALKWTKEKAQDLWDLLDGIGKLSLGGRAPPADSEAQNAPPNGSRELSLAKTKIEEAVFWATRHIGK